MADKTFYRNLHAKYVTMRAGAGIVFDRNNKNGSAQAGMAVMQSGDGEVALITNGMQLHGKLVKVEEDGFCTVQDEGYIDVPTDGTAITFAAGATGANGVVGGAVAGTVKSAAGLGLPIAVATDATGANRVYVKMR